LFKAYFSEGGNPSDHGQLVKIAESVGLDRQRAEAILASDEFAKQVREEEQLWLSRGVSSVPTVVFNGQYAVTGGQPVDAFVAAIRQIISEAKGGTVNT
jgi:predicted DsbA family dithiol-disulfide isomerase